MTVPSRKAKWFSVTTHFEGGRGVRRYVINCRDCKAEASFHHNNMSDDGLRKLFARRGWSVGSRLAKHRCPQCIDAREVRLVQPVPLPAPEPAAAAVEQILREAMKPPSLEAAWAAASAQERDEFLARMGLTKVFATEAAPEPALRGDGVTSYCMVPEPKPEPEPEPEPESEPADWWLELQRQTPEAA